MAETRYKYTLSAAFSADEVEAQVLAAAPVLPGYLAAYPSGQNLYLAFSAPLSAADKLRLDALVAAYVPAPDFTTRQLRTAAQALLSDPQPLMKALRGVMDLLVDENNLLRARLRDQDAAVAAATTLVDLKSRWAAVATADPVPARTGAQARTAVLGKINTGAEDQ